MKLFDVYPLFDIQPVSGQGSWITDQNGIRYLDLYGGHAVISIGHSHPHYVEMIKSQVEKLGFYSNSIQNPLQQELARKLGQLSGYEDYQLFLCNSGAEAIENALKIASFVTGHEKVIAFENAFHGRTSAAVAVTDNQNIQAPINQGHQVTRLPINQPEVLESVLMTDDYCAVVIEGIQGIGGIVIPDDQFLQQVAQMCKNYGTLLILDEIQSGYGRTGKFFAHQYAGIQPDLITMAKGMGNGFPMGGVLIEPGIKAQYGMLGTTFGGNHLACAAGIAVLDVLNAEQLIHHSQITGDWWMEQLSKIEGINAVRGRGLMVALDFDFPVKELRLQLLKEERIFTGSSKHPHTLRLLPPLNVKREELELFDQSLEKLLKSSKKISKANS